MSLTDFCTLLNQCALKALLLNGFDAGWDGSGIVVARLHQASLISFFLQYEIDILEIS